VKAQPITGGKGFERGNGNIYGDVVERTIVKEQPITGGKGLKGEGGIFTVMWLKEC